MEKRLFTALFLSFLVLYGWSYFVIGPKDLDQNAPAELSEVSDIKEVTEVSKPSLLSSEKVAVPPSLMKKPEINEIIDTAETGHLVAEFTNRGGNISKITIKEFDHELPLKDVLNISGYENVAFTLDEISRNKVEYSFDDDAIKIVKRYDMIDDKQAIETEIEVSNKSEMSKLIVMDVDGFQIDLDRLDNNDQRQKMLLEYSIAHNGKIERKKNLSKFVKKEEKIVEESIKWLGFRDQYFCSIIRPHFNTKEYYFKQIDDKRGKVGFKTEQIKLEPGSKVALKVLIYAGPQDTSVLKSFNSGFEKIIDYRIGGFFDIMAFNQTDSIAKLLLVLIEFLHKLIPNWGVSIIIFAFCIYGITFPLTRKSMMAMKRLQEHQPELMKIREKHKNNPQKMQKETMEYYKKYKVNPLGGCLPMLLQMPIFISLYQLLWRSYIFKGANFLWIKDLSEPDRLFIMPFSLPYIGNEFNILPILYGVLMFFQQRMQSKNMTVSDPVQAQTQQMMAKIFPVILGVIFYKFASGLTLYFTTYFMLTALAQWRMSKTSKAA